MTSNVKPKLKVTPESLKRLKGTPTAVPHIGAAYAPWQYWEFGVRFAAGG